MKTHVILRDAQLLCERVDFSQLRDCSVLVTGASGLIGTYFLACLCHLREAGMPIEVYGQTLSTPPPHVAELASRGAFRLFRADLADFREYARLPEVDVTIHSAGYAQPLRFMANPEVTIQINVCATIALLKHLRRQGRFLFLSSSEVYSGLNKALLNEADLGTTTPDHPRVAYIEGKRCGEALCNIFRTHGVHAVAARLGHTYGPGTRKHDRRAMNTFIEKALCQQRIELLDTGAALRTYCYVADAVELLWQVVLHGKESVYNIGGHSTVTIADLARMVGAMVGVPMIFPTVQTEVAGAPEEVCLDLKRVEAEFAKTEYVSLEEGLRATIEWQRGLYPEAE